MIHAKGKKGKKYVQQKRYYPKGQRTEDRETVRSRRKPRKSRSRYLATSLRASRPAERFPRSGNASRPAVVWSIAKRRTLVSPRGREDERTGWGFRRSTSGRGKESGVAAWRCDRRRTLLGGCGARDEARREAGYLLRRGRPAARPRVSRAILGVLSVCGLRWGFLCVEKSDPALTTGGSRLVVANSHVDEQIAHPDVDGAGESVLVTKADEGNVV